MTARKTAPFLASAFASTATCLVLAPVAAIAQDAPAMAPVDARYAGVSYANTPVVVDREVAETVYEVEPQAGEAIEWTEAPAQARGEVMHSEMHHGASPMMHPHQGHTGAMPGTHAQNYDGAWRGEWVSPDRYEGVWEGSYEDDGRPYAPGLAYSRTQRNLWLDQCRANFYRSADRREVRGRDGKVIGGLVGAVAGGVIGNRVADGSRLGGTLIGAGLGGLAGAAIGDAIDKDRPRYDYARDHGGEIDECEAYLRNYEASAGRGYGYGAVTWVRVPIHRVRRAACNCHATEQVVVEEEVIEEVVERPVVPRTVRRVAPRSVKTTKLQSVK